MNEIEFIGIPSGDHEVFCYDVSEEEFIRITGNIPDTFSKSFFNPGTYRLYPHEVLDIRPHGNKPFNIKIKHEIKDGYFYTEIIAVPHKQ